MDDYRGSDYSSFYDMEPPRRHRFAKGFICGFLLAFVVCSAVIVTGLTLMYRSGLTLKLYPKTSRTGGENGAFDKDAVEEKLNLLGMYVDQAYLYDYDSSALAEGIYKGYIYALGDPYTVYYTADEYKSMMETAEGSYHGIGVQVSQNVETGVISIVRVFRNGPAQEAGIQAGDIIYMVDGEEVTGQDLSTVVSRIKGQEGTAIPITVYREEKAEYIEMEVERRQVEVDTVSCRMLENKVGYIEILQFEELTGRQFQDAKADLLEQGMEALIVDLRNNPGGLVASVVEIADELIPEGLIVYMEDHKGEKNEYFADANYLDLPLAVLVNGESASASEILAGAVRDRKAGILVGTNTFGKGIAQSIYPLGDGTALKITTANYYTPDGENIHGKGIAPDIEVKPDPDSGEDRQLNAAWESLISGQGKP